MATVKMLVSITGTRNGEEWPAAGHVVTLPRDEASSLIAGGLAVAVESAAVVETATAPVPEVSKPRRRASKATAPKGEER